MKVSTDIDLPEGCVPIYQVVVVMSQTPSGDMIVSHHLGSNVDKVEGDVPVLTAVGMLELVKDSILHPPQDGGDD